MEEENLEQKILPLEKNVGKRKKFYFQKWNLTQKDFKKWGKLGGRPPKYASNKERWKAYRRKKAQKRIESGEVEGILNWTTGRINKRKN